MFSNNDLEQRVAVLEKKFTDLKNLLQPKPREKDWLRTVGMFADDPHFEEMVRLGREYREQENERSLQ